jgi:hypothetical protein
LLVLWAVGRLDWALYATFGPFTSVYGGGSPAARRWRLQTGVGVVLACAVLSGALVGLSPHRDWLSIPVAAGWAALPAWLSDRLTLRPPRPLFPVPAGRHAAGHRTAAAGLASPLALGRGGRSAGRDRAAGCPQLRAALIFFTPRALLPGQLADPQPILTLLSDRLLETLIGVGIGIVTVFLTRRRRSPTG